MGAIEYYPKRIGYTLTEEGERAFTRWSDDYDSLGGCTCWQISPCSICTHEDHPYSIEETDEYWVKEEEEMSRTEIVDKSKEKSVEYKVGDKVKVIQNTSHHDIPLGTIVTLEYRTYPCWRTDWPGLDAVYPIDIEPYIEYKAGDKVKIIGNSNSHCYEIGDIVTLIGERDRNRHADKFYWCTEESRSRGCVREEDIEPYLENIGVTKTCSVTATVLEAPIKNITITGTIVYDTKTNQQTKGDLNMSNTQRRVVTVVLIDPDQGLPVEDSQVHDFGQIVTEDDDATTIQELIMTGDVQAKLDIHNKVRSERVDLDVLKRTGNEVKLQPVKLKQLKWIIK